MSRFILSKRSLERLQGVHPDLVSVVKRAIEITKVDFCVGEGLRTLSTQKRYVEQGKSKTMDSRHLTGHAVDLWAYCDGHVVWSYPLYEIISQAVLKAADELKIPVVWGGSWTKFKDGCHFELSKKYYPALPVQTEGK